MAIPCHDANILLRDGLAPAGRSRCKFRFDFGGDVAEVRRHCAKLEVRARARWVLSLLCLQRIGFSDRANLSQVVKGKFGAP